MVYFVIDFWNLSFQARAKSYVMLCFKNKTVNSFFINLHTDPCLLSVQCAVLNEKLDSLLQTLNTEAQAISPPSLTTPPIVEEELEEEELEEEDFSEESLTELKEKMEENVTEKDSPHKLFRPREQLMLRANSLKKAVRQIIEQAEKSNNNRPEMIIML